MELNITRKNRWCASNLQNAFDKFAEIVLFTNSKVVPIFVAVLFNFEHCCLLKLGYIQDLTGIFMLQFM